MPSNPYDARESRADAAQTVSQHGRWPPHSPVGRAAPPQPSGFLLVEGTRTAPQDDYYSRGIRLLNLPPPLPDSYDEGLDRANSRALERDDASFFGDALLLSSHSSQGLLGGERWDWI